MMETGVFFFFVFAWEAVRGYLARIFVGREANILKCYTGKHFYLFNTYGYMLGHQLQHLRKQKC